jgi:pyridoxamine 5'-phosphate oxidase
MGDNGQGSIGSDSSRIAAALRLEYTRAGLVEGDMAASPIAQFERWFQEALGAELAEVNAATLATAGADGEPDGRIVLLKGFDDRGFVFYTNYESAKARALASNPRAALVFFWRELERQVRIRGVAVKVAREESEAYFRSRPLGSQLGAWASEQSEVIASRAVIEARFTEVMARFAGADVPLPPFWGGYRVEPQSIEFWQGRPSRLHDRLRYTRILEGAWKLERLSP